MKKQVIITMEKLVEIANGTQTTSETMTKSWMSEDHKLVISLVWYKVGHLAQIYLAPVIRVGLRHYVSPDLRVKVTEKKIRNPLDAEKWVRSTMRTLTYAETAEGVHGYTFELDGKKIAPVFLKWIPNHILKVVLVIGDGKGCIMYAIDARKPLKGRCAMYAHDYNPSHTTDLVKLVDINEYSYSFL